MSPPGSPTFPPIVVADQGEAMQVLRRSLPPHLGLAAAATLEQAKRLVEPDTPLVLCDPHFDDGRMYDLLRWLKGRQDLQRVRFMAVRVREGELDDTLYESVKIATEALGADGFVDLFRWQVRYGPDTAARDGAPGPRFDAFQCAAPCVNAQQNT